MRERSISIAVQLIEHMLHEMSQMVSRVPCYDVYYFHLLGMYGTLIYDLFILPWDIDQNTYRLTLPAPLAPTLTFILILTGLLILTHTHSHSLAHTHAHAHAYAPANTHTHARMHPPTHTHTDNISAI